MNIPILTSKLPQVGTTIFTVMSALAQQHGAVNLGQGFPDFDCDPALLDAVNAAMRAGHNQYPPMAGIAPLREAISQKMAALYGQAYDPADEITITAGGTQGLLTAILCCIQRDDEVIVLEPAYDSYVPAIQLAGGVPVGVAMTADYRIDWPAVRAAITPRTRALILNTPHNPSGRVASAEDLQTLSALAEQHNLLIISDEVYEHMVFDGQPQHSVAAYSALAARSFVVSSFGKTFHVTGWKIGYVAAPRALMNEFRKVHQFNVFTVNTPVQYGITQYLQDPRPWQDLSAFYQAKRDLFRQGLAQTGLRLLPCEGTYFQTVDYSALSDLPEVEFARWLTTEIGVAAIPLSVFYQQTLERQHVRFCFAKKESTLQQALEKLQQLGK
ncbi:pyridoxal phosphate-dependent aminotransferase [Parvibium lacunae]|uniref:Pyridoxal phosphate-dependent aminotransferase n=1 Tax=Parvibium lacunae TaxID=1888893 RepID=A0A368L6R8_9BURK|nr:pyridoxal phosphate-dependent aminotransferase [Parvibium lacunae]RCS59317.1 pyridoxal phosphate-dependent aminotransferase [Parvibium lacunae]